MQAYSLPMYILTKGFISSILIASIKIYMMFTLTIYIYRPTEIVNVTMYCCRHVICNFSYYMYSRMCNPTEQVSHTSTSVDRHNTETRGKRWSDHRREGRAHVCPISYNTSLAHTLGYSERDDTLYTFLSVYTVYWTQYCNCIIKVCYITWKHMNVVT